jgi:hypothetical protein
MICVAAFIILLLLSVPVLVLHFVGKRSPKVAKITKPYGAMFKKAWHCVGRRASFRKCDSNFKTEIKNSLLKKVVLKRPKLVKPLGILIEVVAVLIVAAAIWSLVEVVKSGLSLYVYGTCNVAKPEACVLGEGEVCSTEDTAEKNPLEQYIWEWSEIITGLPARVKHWNAADYIPAEANAANFTGTKSANFQGQAVDILDPGCINCLSSFNSQLQGGFFGKYETYLLPYPIKDSAAVDGYKFPNSYLITTYLEAVREFKNEQNSSPEWEIMKKIFTEQDPELGISYQQAFNGLSGLAGTPYSAAKIEQTLQNWLAEWGYSPEQIAEIAKNTHSEKIAERIKDNQRTVDQTIKTKGIPTLIYDGQRHIGVWKNS